MSSDFDHETRWHDRLTGRLPLSSYLARQRHRNGLIPSRTRCKLCHRPFEGLGRILLRARPSNKNPRFCSGCIKLCDTNEQGGAEVVISMLFVDVRGSTRLAERMGSADFSHLMNRFYKVATAVLIKTDGYIDKFVGDEVIGLYVPWFTGDKNHAQAAIEAARQLLPATGHGNRKGPWLPVGIGVHTGSAFVGTVEGTENTVNDVTALGDNMNVTARLASEAGAGEILVSDQAYNTSGLDLGGREQRRLSLKGKSEPVSVRVLT